MVMGQQGSQVPQIFVQRPPSALRFGVFLVFCVLLACSKTRGENTTAPVPPPAVAASAAAVAPCDVSEAWGAEMEKAGLDKEVTPALQQAFTQKLKSWTADCRWQALVGLCEYGCDSGDDAISGFLVEGAVTRSEKQTVLQYRLERNEKRATKWRELYSKTKGVVNHALSIQSSPRSNAYLPANPTAEQVAENLSNGDPCMRRMKADDLRIYAAVTELDRDDTKRLLQVGAFAPLRDLLPQTHSCGDCSDDRSACKNLRSDLKEAEDNLLKFEKEIASEKRLLATVTSTTAAN